MFPKDNTKFVLSFGKVVYVSPVEFVPNSSNAWEGGGET